MPAIYRNGTRYGNAPTSYPAENVAYDPTTSNLPATNAQNAIDELADATPRIASAGPAAEVIFNTDTVAPFQEIKCSVNAIQEGTPWIDSNVIEKEPYNFRKVAGTASRIGNHLFDKLVGGTVAWNQLVQNGNFADSSHWSKSANTFDYVFANNTVTLTATTTLTRWNGIQNSSIDSAVVGHKVLIHATTKAQHGIVEIGANATTPTPQYNYISGEWCESFALLRIDESSQPHFFQIRFGTSYSEYQIGESIKAKNAYAVDLTAMFGSTIADYIYSLEQATAGAGVAWFRALFPNDYYAYNAGELVSVKTTAHKMVGFNQWDEQTELGLLNSDGSVSDSTNRLITKNHVQVTPNTEYCVHIPYNGRGRGAFYDANKNLISYFSDFPKSGESVFPNDGVIYSSGTDYYFTFIPPTGACYVIYNMVIGYGTIYNNDICINLSKTTGSPKNGDYVAYSAHNYALDDVELRGLFKLDSNNKLYADGDTYESSGDVTRKYIKVQLSSIDWYLYQTADGNLFRCYPIPNCNLPYNSTDIICSKYTTIRAADRTQQTISVGNGYSGQIDVLDDRYNSVDDFVAANIGVYMVFPLETPTTETADPFTNPQQVDANGTEEYVDNRSVAIPVGHETYYADIYDISGFTSCKVSVKDGSNVEQKSATISFGQTVYDGILEYKNGAWVFTGTSAVLIFDGSSDESWSNYSNSDNQYRYWIALTNCKTDANGEQRANYLQPTTGAINSGNSSIIKNNHESVSLFSDGSKVYINANGVISNDTLEVFKEYLSNNPLKLLYPLATPFTLALTGAQLETLLGENRVSHNCNGDIEVKYYTSGVSVIKDLIDATPIDDLSNVSISSPTNNQILTYNSTSSKWENKAPVVDSSLSSTSTNPVQNKVINTALGTKADKATTYTKTEVDDKFEDIEPIGTATGNPCNFVTDSALSLASLKAEIVASGGNGTPSTPIPIVGHSELNLVRCGKNFVNSEGYLSNAWNIYGIKNYLKPNTTYTYSVNGTTAIRYSVWLSNDGTTTLTTRQICAYIPSGSSVTFTTPADMTEGWLLFGGQSSAGSDIKFNDVLPQIELGSRATAYEPYNGTPYLVSFGQTVYGGTYTADGKLRITHTYIADMSSLNWQYNSVIGNFYTELTDVPKVFSSENYLTSKLCSMFTIVDGSVGSVNHAMQYYNSYLRFRVEEYSDVPTFKQAIENCQFAYELATPIEIDVSELSVDTIVGVNNIISDGGGDVEVQYLKNADMAEFVETIHNSLSPIILTGTLNVGETSITFLSDAITEDSLIEIYTDPNIFYTGTTTSDGEIEITFPERQYNVSVKVRII